MEFTADQFQELIATVTNNMMGMLGGNGKAAGKGGGFRGNRRTLQVRDFSAMKKFSGGDGNCKEWSFDFRMLVELAAHSREKLSRRPRGSSSTTTGRRASRGKT